MEDDSFWVKWLNELRADEYTIVDKLMFTHGFNNNTAGPTAEEPPAPRLSGTSYHDDHVSHAWEPDSTVELDLYDWKYTGTTQLSVLSCILTPHAG